MNDMKDMSKATGILQLLQAQWELLRRVEEATNLMLYAEADELTDIVAERGVRLQQAAELQQRIRLEASGDEALEAAVSCSSDMASLTEEQARLFEAALRVRAAVNRIQGLEPDVRRRLEDERDGALKRLEALNLSSTSVAAGYEKGVQTGFTRGLGDNTRSI